MYSNYTLSPTKKQQEYLQDLSFSHYVKELPSFFTANQFKVANYLFKKIVLHDLKAIILESTIAQACGVSLRTVIKTIALLKNLDLIDIKYRWYQSSVYTLGLFFKKIMTRFELGVVFPALLIIPATLLKVRKLFYLNSADIEVTNSSFFKSSRASTKEDNLRREEAPSKRENFFPDQTPKSEVAKRYRRVYEELGNWRIKPPDPTRDLVVKGLERNLEQLRQRWPEDQLE